MTPGTQNVPNNMKRTGRHKLVCKRAIYEVRHKTGGTEMTKEKEDLEEKFQKFQSIFPQ